MHAGFIGRVGGILRHRKLFPQGKINSLPGNMIDHRVHLDQPLPVEADQQLQKTGLLISDLLIQLELVRGQGMDILLGKKDPLIIQGLQKLRIDRGRHFIIQRTGLYMEFLRHTGNEIGILYDFRRGLGSDW